MKKFAVNQTGGSLRKGLYYYRIQAGSFTAAKKLISGNYF